MHSVRPPYMLLTDLGMSKTPYMEQKARSASRGFENVWFWQTKLPRLSC